jgi:hypothetical protein
MGGSEAQSSSLKRGALIGPPARHGSQRPPKCAWWSGHRVLTVPYISDLLGRESPVLQGRLRKAADRSRGRLVESESLYELQDDAARPPIWPSCVEVGWC